MKKTLHTRFILARKQWMSSLFWLIFPLGMTLLIMNQIGVVQDDIKIPIGLVIEDDSIATDQLIHAMKTKEHLRPIILKEQEALHELETHEIDSVFIIRENYEQKIEQGRRNHVIDAYDSDLSFAYPSVRETIISLVQQDYMLATTVQTIQQMAEAYNVDENWTAESLKHQSETIVEEQRLLDVNFSFAGESTSEQSKTSLLIDPQHLWMLLTTLATFMIFDWVVNEKKERAINRLIFTQLSIKNYLLNNWLIYTVLLFLFDCLTIYILSQTYSTFMNWKVILSLFFFRLMLNSCIFIISYFFNIPIVYYIFSFSGTLFLTVVSGVFIPIDGISQSIPLFSWIHPFVTFQANGYFNIWLVIGLSAMFIFYFRKEETHA